jgi:uncharacterized membrane protein YkoI
MPPSKVLMGSVFITAVILVMIGGLTSNVFANKTAASPAVSPDVVQAYQKREAQYNQLIQQANQQLEQANKEMQTLQSQVAELKQQEQQAAAQPAIAAAISPDQANQIAQQAADPGEKLLKNADLVSFQGKTAYEVDFEKGAVYIDAQSGDVLFNGAVPHRITQEKAIQVVSDYLGLTDILEVKPVKIGINDEYRIIFTNGTMVWIDLYGQIHDIQYPAPRAQASTNSGGGGGGGSGGSSSQPSGGDSGHDHEGGDD